MKIRLYHYWRSSSSWRIRWAFALKGIECEFAPVNLLNDETERPEHLARNPMGYVPVLEFLDGPASELPGRGRFLTESMAIIEWAEETRPEPRLLPGEPHIRARIRQLAELINSGIQPIQNPNVASAHSSDPEAQKAWNQLWIRKGFSAYEAWASESAGRFSVGDTITLADLFLIPQCYNAARQGVTLEAYPTIERIQRNALETAACIASHPDRFKPQD